MQRETTSPLPETAGRETGGILRRKCDCGTHTVAGGACKSCVAGDDALLRRKPAGEAAAPMLAPDIIHDVLGSGGEALDGDARARMEPRFGHDFSRVRIHTGGRAAESARSVGALAYTVGDDVVFGGGNYRPGSVEGEQLLAHELTHVVQGKGAAPAPRAKLEIGAADDSFEREADRVAANIMEGRRVSAMGDREPVLRRVSFGQKIARFFGGGTFDEPELLTYLELLNTSKRIEDNYDSDNKARDVVRRWKAKEPKFAIITIPTRILLIQEMLSGYVSGDDENAILDLLTEAITGERTTIIATVGADTLKKSFSGDNLKKLLALIDSEQESAGLARGEKWTIQGVMEIINRHGDDSAIRTLIDQGYKVFSVEAAFDKWRNNADGTIVEEELKGFRGNTCITVEDGCPKPKEIRIREALNDSGAATALFHEIQHVVRGETATHDAELNEEVDVRVDTEEFRSRHGMGPFKPSYRNPDGSVNKAAIDKEVHGSGHYNPSDRERVGRRYQGEKEITGWQVPAKNGK